MSDISQVWKRLVTDVQRSVRYHIRRERFFDRWEKFITASNFILSSTAVAALMSELVSRTVPVVAGAAIAVASVVDLVVGTSQMARRHSELARRFIALERSLRSRAVDETAISEATSERLRIEEDEPPTLRVVDLLCHNEMVKVLGGERDQMYKISKWKKILGSFFHLDFEGLRTFGEIKEKKARAKRKKGTTNKRKQRKDTSSD